MTKQPYETLIVAPSGESRSVLDTLLRLEGVAFAAGPVNTDGPAEFAEAAHAAHDIERCMPHLHDTVLDAIGQSMDDNQLRSLLATLPPGIREQIEEWGLADTEVREQIHAYLRRAPL